MVDLERISIDTLDKYNELKRSSMLYLDNTTHQLVYGGESVTLLTIKEYETVLSYYKKYRRYTIEGGNCVGCTIQKMANVDRDFMKFLSEIKNKYYGIKGV